MGMNIRVELCHVDTLRCVVRVEAWDETRLIASSLGEAPSAEEAEDRAFRRLTQRLEPKKQTQIEQVQPVHAAITRLPASSPEPIAGVAANSLQTRQVDHFDNRSKLSTASSNAQSPPPSTPSLATSPKAPTEIVEDGRPSQLAYDQPSESPTDPDDWSEELTAIDFEVKRIGWAREQERQYLERAFGHASRHRLTRYADLVAFLRQLRQIQPGESPEQSAVPIRRSDLITQGDQMLTNLGWTGEQARAFLQKHLHSTSRQQLSDEQLLQFNMLLEEQTLAKS